ncbi:energy transducer TonB [Pontibacter diazotrophicus]|nr:energy transducer TonB [Pontibacter diazotrophicus]
MTKLPLIPLLLLLLAGTPSVLHAQSTKASTTKTKAVAAADESTAPEFQGGREAMLQFLAKNTKYPTRAQLTKTEGLVMMQVTIDKAGKLTDIKAAYSDSPLLETEPLRVLKQMTTWKPAKNNTVPVASTYLFPFMFHMPGKEGSNKDTLMSKCINFTQSIPTSTPDQPLFIAEEVTVTGYGVVK